MAGENNSIVVILLLLVLIFLGIFGFYFFVGFGTGKKSIKGHVGTGFHFGYPRENYVPGQGVLGTEAEARGITALTAHTPGVLRPPDMRVAYTQHSPSN